MPKITSWKEKETWYARAEQGESVSTMAREYKKDPRTLQRGIDDIRRHRAAQGARESLLRESLRHHLEELLILVERAARVVLPPPAHPEFRFMGVEPPLFLEIGPVRVDRQGDEFNQVALEVEQEFTWGLLREHLGRSREFRLLGRWKKAFLEALKSNLALRQYLLGTIQKDLGLSLSDEIHQSSLIRPAAAEELAKAAVSRILVEDSPYDLEITQMNEGEFLVNGVSGGMLSIAGTAVQVEFDRLLHSVISSTPGQSLRQAYDRANEAANNAKEALELVRASYYLPGTCRACRRYGGI